MKTLRLLLLTLFCIGLTVPAVSDDNQIYDNGPINGTDNAYYINFGLYVSDSFTVSGSAQAVNGIAFGAWVVPGDVLQSAEVLISSQPDGGTTYFDQDVDFTGSGCATNQFGYNVCTETGRFTGPTLNSGTYWLTLENAQVSFGDPARWDVNAGAGCTSPGCPSQAETSTGTIASESFTVLGGPATGTTPESGSFVLFATGIVTVAGVLRRRLIS